MEDAGMSRFFTWFFDIEDHPDEPLVHQTARFIAGLIYVIAALAISLGIIVGGALLLRGIAQSIAS